MSAQRRPPLRRSCRAPSPVRSRGAYHRPPRPLRRAQWPDTQTQRPRRELQTQRPGTQTKPGRGRGRRSRRRGGGGLPGRFGRDRRRSGRGWASASDDTAVPSGTANTVPSNPVRKNRRDSIALAPGMMGIRLDERPEHPSLPRRYRRPQVRTWLCSHRRKGKEYWIQAAGLSELTPSRSGKRPEFARKNRSSGDGARAFREGAPCFGCYSAAAMNPTRTGPP